MSGGVDRASDRVAVDRASDRVAVDRASDRVAVDRASDRFAIDWRPNESAPARSLLWDSSQPLVLARLWVLERINREPRIWARPVPRPGRERASVIPAQQAIRLEIGNGADPEWLALESARIRFRLLPKREAAVANPGFERFALAPDSPDRDPSDQAFRRSSRATAGILALFFVVTAVWRAVTEPAAPLVDPHVLPPQVAKILMKPSRLQKPKTAVAQSGGTRAPRSARETAVAQALGSRSLNQALAKLASGTRGLAGSLAGSAPSRLFDLSRRSAETASAKGALGELLRADPTRVGLMGGGNGSGAGVSGYARGAGSGLTGQGRALASLDLGVPMVEEGLTKEEVGRVIHAHMQEIRYCYESAMLQRPELEGKLVMDFAIGPAGVVTRSGVQQSSAGDPRLDTCILKRLASWQFPKPRGGVTVAVTYPFLFKAVGR